MSGRHFTSNVQEQHWLVPRDDLNQSTTDTITSTELTGTFLIVGTNGTFCFALVECAGGAIGEYLLELQRVERLSFYQASKFTALNVCQTNEDAKELMVSLLDIAKVDPQTMRHPVSALGPIVSKQLRELPPSHPPKEDGKARPASAPRPGGGYAEIKQKQVTVVTRASPPSPEGKEGEESFVLLMTPVTGEEKTWKNMLNTQIYARSGTVPVVAFSDTHVAILYQPAAAAAHPVDVMCLELYNLSTLKRVNRVYFLFSAVFGGAACGASGANAPSLLHAALGPPSHNAMSCPFAIGFGGSVAVFNVATDVTMHAQDALDVNVFLVGGKRTITTVHLSGGEAAASVLVFGTDRGECYGINTADAEEGSVLFIDHCPAVEPVFSVSYSAAAAGGATKRICMHTCMAVSIPGDEIVVMPMDRPLAVTTCGSLIVTLTKYGHVKILSSIVRGVAREFEPPSRASSAYTLQHTYRGVHASPDHVVCVYPDGRIRTISLTHTK
jgi:hypothetical protein